jgi:hypothetical protein
MPPSPIGDYLNTLRANLRAGEATEGSHYPTLKALIEAAASGVSASRGMRLRLGRREVLAHLA